jgi:D-alanyl-D-alanine carboxypeptidase (penicillin-binding protein 5/6)
LRKRLAIGGVAALLCMLLSIPASANPPAPRGRAALLMDGTSGQILYQQNGVSKNYPASTTKLLTALVAVEHGDLHQMIQVSSKAVDQPWDSSSCYLEQGESQPLEHLLYGLLLASGNDCAVAIAEGVTGGKPDQFVAWMNETARRLGANQSNFTNPHGLHDPNHYTSALDLALIARGALSNPTIRKISGAKEFFWPGKSERNGTYYNHNAMVFTYDGTVGGKTGYTEEAGLTLVSAAERNGRLLIGVVMGEPDKAAQYGDMTALLDYGFSSFEQQEIVRKDQLIGQVPVKSGRSENVSAIAQRSFVASVPKGETSQLRLVPKLQPLVQAPVASGQDLGALEVWEGDRLLDRIPVVAGQAIEVSPLSVTGLKETGLRFLKGTGYTLLGLFLFRTTVITIRRTRRRYRRRHAYRRAKGPDFKERRLS